MLRVGYGVDMLRLVDNRRLVLGGVDIPFEKGLDGPGEGDVLVRAVIDAYLGACAFCDPGPVPPIENGEEDLNALQELARVGKRASEIDYGVINLDATLLIHRPRISRYLDKMRRNIAEALGITPLDVSIKERSPEGLGPAGRGEGIEARVMMLVEVGDK